MSFRNKLLAVLIAWPVLGVLLMFLAGAISHWFAITLILALVGFGPHSMSIKCPQFGRTVILRYGVLAAQCQLKRRWNCGHSLT